MVGALSSCVTGVSRQELAEEYFNLGNAHFELGNFDRSYRYYQQAIALSDRFPAAGYNLVRLLIERGDLAGARELLTRLEEEDRENLLLLETGAYLSILEGNYEDAIRSYRHILTVSPARTRVAFNLGALHMRREEYSEAFAVLREYREFSETDREYVWMRAEAAHRSGDELAALEALERYQILVAEDGAALVRLIRRYVDWEYFLPALEVVEVVPQAVLVNREYLFAVAAAHLLGTSDFHVGRQYLREALDAGFTDRQSLMDILRRLRDDEEADLLQIEGLQEILDAEEPPDPPEQL